MNIGDKIRQIREAKGLTQKEVSLTIGMDQSQYSKIEKGKTDPSTSTVDKIAKAIGIELSDLFASHDVLKDINSYDKSLMEKLHLIEQLDEEEKKSIFNIVDGLVSKKKLRDTLTNALSGN
ncbi:helix-turn-helix transcriptional regulator [Marivirga sp.]|uniref:helix-turn-helix domain-containing protein n=1 Tax=Marivirga sp. TaxID=2018662 RepID=UPI0025CBA2F9|nr:helix-turn-helix transcriptional regulator [Marivirga sp.]